MSDSEIIVAGDEGAIIHDETGRYSDDSDEREQDHDLAEWSS